jgi:hypothetical protein
MMQRGGQDYYFHTDGSDNIIMAVTDGNGLTRERYSYSDYGQPSFFDGSGSQIDGSAIGNPSWFDPETGLLNSGPRYFDPITGRSTTRAGFAGDDDELPITDDVLARVKVKFPWIPRSDTEDWAPKTALAAGGNRGFYSLPEVDDEVLIVFLRGPANVSQLYGLSESDKSSMQYLMLQNHMQRRTRQLTLISNIMKMKHSTTTTIIRNIK